MPWTGSWSPVRFGHDARSAHPYSQHERQSHYISSSFASDNNAHPAYAVASAPSSGVFNQPLYSSVLPAAGGALTANDPVVFSGSAVHGSAPFRRR